MRQVRFSKVATAVLVGGLTLGLAGCGGKGGDGFTSTFGNLLAYNSTKAPPLTPTSSLEQTIAVECPTVGVTDGQAAYRSGGADGSSVRYQFSFGELARECTAGNGQVTIRVGVSGYVLAGPAGGPGTYSVPVTILVKSQDTEQVVASRVVRVSATIKPGESQAAFTFVADPISVPYLRPEADQDYDIFVGFDPRGGAAEKPVRSSRKPKRG